MRENPRPTRHLEHVEPEQFGKPLPGSITGPVWVLGPLPDRPVLGEPTTSGDAESADPAAPGDAQGSDPAASSGEGSRKRSAMVAGGVVLAVLALVIGGLTVLGDRTEDPDATTAVERAALDLPFIAPDEPASDRSAGPVRREETQPRDPAEAGDGAAVSRPGDTPVTPGTQTGQGGQTSQGGTTESGAGTGTEGGTGSSTGTGTGSSGGGERKPTATPPPPTSDPTAEPTRKPTPQPTPSATGEPTPTPTPTPSPTPTASPTPEPTGEPVAPTGG